MGSRILKISKYKPSVFQGSLGFSAKRAGFSLTSEHPFEKATLRILIAVLFGLIAAYMYFVSASVLNVIARKEAVSEMASLGSSVSLLERDYYALAAAIKPGEGARLGLSPVSTTKYVHRPGTVGTATIRPNEI